MKTILFVILDQWAEWEAAYLASAIGMLCGSEYTVKTVSVKKEAVKSIGGFNVLPDYDIYSVPKEYEALVLVGGMSWRSEAARRIKPLAETCIAEGRVLGGICDAAGFLGTIGVLNNVRHTGNDLEDIKAWSGTAYSGEKNYIREQAVRDKNIVTANGTASLEFAREVLFALNAAPKDKIEDWYNFHKLGYYGAPMPKM